MSNKQKQDQQGRISASFELKRGISPRAVRMINFDWSFYGTVVL